MLTKYAAIKLAFPDKCIENPMYQIEIGAASIPYE